MSALAAALLAAALLLWQLPAAVPAELLGPRERRPRAVPVVEIASCLELLALALRSGCGLVEALEVVGAQVDDIAGAHLRTVAAALRWGLPDDEAWAAVPAAWLPAAQALTLASRAGVAPAELLLSRDLSYSEAFGLAKQQEEEDLFREMQSDVVLQVVRRLASVRL